MSSPLEEGQDLQATVDDQLQWQPSELARDSAVNGPEKVWGIHNDTIPASTLVAQGFVSVGWDEVADLRTFGNDQESIKIAVAQAYPTAKPGAVAAWAGVLRRFAFELATGDLVVAPSKERPVFHIGRVVGEYEHHGDVGRHRHRRRVDWLLTDVPRNAFTQTARYELGSAITFFQVANHADEVKSAVLQGVSAPVVEDGTDQVRYGLLQKTVLEVLRDHGRLQRREVLQALADRMDFTDLERQQTNSGISRYEAALNWGSVDMRAARWIDKTPEGWLLTDTGRAVLEQTPESVDLAKLSSAAYREQQAAKRQAEGRYKTPRYPLIDAAVKLIGEGQWITYSDIATVVGSNPSSVGEYLLDEAVALEGSHRVVPVGRPPYRPDQRDSLVAEGVAFDARGLPDPTSQVTAGDLREEMDLLGLLPKIPRRAWLIRGSNVNGKNLVPGWLAEGRVSLPGSSLRPVQPHISRDELKSVIDEDYAHASYAVKGEKLDDFHAFLTRMLDGHIVVTVDHGRLYIGTLVGEPWHQPSPEGDANLVRDVDWVDDTGIDYGGLPGELAARLKVQRDLLDLTQQLEILEGLLQTESVRMPARPTVDVALPDATEDLAEELHVPRAWLQECVELLRDRPQLIYYGPPGTGKTFLAQALARHIAGDNVRLVQFHPAYSYEDFFEGYRPTDAGGFKLHPGPMRKIVDQANENPRDVFVLIIDEINRGNLAKVFGELYFLLEYRDENVELLYADGDFSLPKNVVIIGTMNTADRSIALVDSAMRRRFAFVPLHPSEEPTKHILRAWLRKHELPSDVADMHDELNQRIDDPDFKIGPSYFMRPAVHKEGGLERVWRTSILPLLEEHHFGELGRAEVEARYGAAAVTAAVVSAAGGDSPADDREGEGNGDAAPDAD